MHQKRIAFISKMKYLNVLYHHIFKTKYAVLC